MEQLVISAKFCGLVCTDEGGGYFKATEGGVGIWEGAGRYCTELTVAMDHQNFSVNLGLDVWNKLL